MENEPRNELHIFLELELQTIGSFNTQVILPDEQIFEKNDGYGTPTLLTTTMF